MTDDESMELEIEKSYPAAAVAAKLRRLADALEAGRSFAIQIGGQRVRVPADASVEFEYQRDGDDEEFEIELKWTRR
jgi:amphi-Trp domain-containing protein